MKRFVIFIAMSLAVISSCSRLEAEHRTLMATIEYTFNGDTVKQSIYAVSRGFIIQRVDPQSPTLWSGFTLGRYYSGQLLLDDSLARYYLSLHSDSLSICLMVRSNINYFNAGTPYYLDSCDSTEYTYGMYKREHVLRPETLCRLSCQGCQIEESFFDEYEGNYPDIYLLLKDQSWCSFSVPDNGATMSVLFDFKAREKNKSDHFFNVTGRIDIYKTSYQTINNSFIIKKEDE